MAVSTSRRANAFHQRRPPLHLFTFSTRGEAVNEPLFKFSEAAALEGCTTEWIFRLVKLGKISAQTAEKTANGKPYRVIPLGQLSEKAKARYHEQIPKNMTITPTSVAIVATPHTKRQRDDFPEKFRDRTEARKILIRIVLSWEGSRNRDAFRSMFSEAAEAYRVRVGRDNAPTLETVLNWEKRRIARGSDLGLVPKLREDEKQSRVLKPWVANFVLAKAVGSADAAELSITAIRRELRDECEKRGLAPTCQVGVPSTVT
jgi:hypothetical protein